MKFDERRQKNRDDQAAFMLDPSSMGEDPNEQSKLTNTALDISNNSISQNEAENNPSGKNIFGNGGGAPPMIGISVDPVGAAVNKAAEFFRPEYIANAFAFLASDDASYITGVVLSVDGMARV